MTESKAGYGCLWVVHEQLKFDDECETEGLVTRGGGLDRGMSVAGFYRTKASANAASEQAFYGYMQSAFGWDRQQVKDNCNDSLPFQLGQVMDNGTAMYYWEGPVERKVMKVIGEERQQVSVEQYAVITFSPWPVVVSN